MTENIIQQQVFTYPVFPRLLFRFGNVIVTLILGFYLVPMVVLIDKNNILIIPILVTLFLIYYVNKHFFMLYKILPYKIEADNEKIICSEFFISKKEVIIFYEDITALKGAVFENRLSGVMKVIDSKNSVSIGFYRNLRNSNKLITIILSKVKRDLYDEVLDNITSKKKK